MDEGSASEGAKRLLLQRGLQPGPAWFEDLFGYAHHAAAAIRTLAGKAIAFLLEMERKSGVAQHGGYVLESLVARFEELASRDAKLGVLGAIKE